MEKRRANRLRRRARDQLAMMDEEVELERDGDEPEKTNRPIVKRSRATHDRDCRNAHRRPDIRGRRRASRARCPSQSSPSSRWPLRARLLHHDHSQKGVHGRKCRQQVASRGDHLVVGVRHRALQLGARLVPRQPPPRHARSAARLAPHLVALRRRRSPLSPRRFVHPHPRVDHRHGRRLPQLLRRRAGAPSQARGTPPSPCSSSR